MAPGVVPGVKPVTRTPEGAMAVEGEEEEWEVSDGIK